MEQEKYCKMNRNSYLKGQSHEKVCEMSLDGSLDLK
jgi:hypothetical protein